MSPQFVIDHAAVAVAYAIALYAVAFGLCAVLVRGGEPRRLTESTSGRIGAIDGLRGVLAIGVLVHHSVISYIWATSGRWALTPNAVVNQLGHTSVALFFMITGFLFTLKTMEPVAWIRFYGGRLARLGPLYVVFVGLLFALVFVQSGGELRVGPLRLLKELAMWLAFGAFGRPDVNAYPATWIIVAGVNWSLKYEAIFYVVFVPVLFWINRLVSDRTGLVVAFVTLTAFLIVFQLRGPEYGDLLYSIHFLGGIVVARIYSMPNVRPVLGKWFVRWAAVVASCLLVLPTDAANLISIIAAIVIFAAIAGGASCFGLLKTRPAIWLGDISYGVYLLQGFLLWGATRFVAMPMSLAGFLLLACAVTSVVVLAATVSYTLLERPAMKWVNRAIRSTNRLAPELAASR